MTAELAAALPALLLMFGLVLTGVSAAATKMRCLAAARDVALAESRGEDGAAAAGRTLPQGGRVDTRRDGDLVRVSVSAPVVSLGWRLPWGTVDADAVAAAEPGAP